MFRTRITRNAGAYLAGLVAFGLMSAIARPSFAQPFDHLQCFKIKDPSAFEAVADLVPAAAPFVTSAGCAIKVRGAEYCVAVDKQLTSSTAPGPNFPPTGTDPQNDFVCYKLKCPKQTVSPFEITDQFGTRTISGFRSSKKVCVPAIQGGAPPAPACGDSTAPTCDGSCPLAGLQCTPLGMTCLCQVALSSPCGTTLGAPECHGECPVGEACIDDGGTCTCVAQ